MAPHSSPAVKLQSRAAAPSAMGGAHRWSHAIAKTAPPRKIRIVHVLAPEVIKTDVGQFRDLVQRLTGKPNGDGVGGTPSSSSTSESAAESLSQPTWSSDAASAVVVPAATAAAVVAANTTIKAEVKEEVEEAVASPATPGEEEGIPDMIDDVFFQELEDFLFSSTSSCHMDGGWL